MRKIGLLLLLVLLLLSGCATYKFQKGSAPYDKGYVVSYDDKLIPEYTLGQDNSVPELALAKERFSRRRATVEYYYKQMDQIEARFKEVFLDPPIMFLDLLGGLLRWPFVAVADYRYNHNPRYKEKVDQLDEQREAMEKSRISNLKEKLKVYIDEDLAKELGQKELPVSEAAAPAQQAPVAAASAAPIVTTAPSELSPVVHTEEKKVTPIAPVNPESLVAVIIAKPTQGPSPLQVNFTGGKSYSYSSKIVSYIWDFGDGDTSSKKNTVNTYWSTTYGSRNFTATLTVKDEKGQTATASTNIEVLAQ